MRCVGEGGNLGLTQRGRIEYALAGGRITTDFIDNSAGVDTSDHEVNIKILLDRVVADGDLTGKQRNALLQEMTDEVGRLVLADNDEQNLALANASSAPRRCCTCTRTGCAGWSGPGCSTGRWSSCRTTRRSPGGGTRASG